MDRTTIVAVGMLRRYSTVKVAYEMALLHAADYPDGTETDRHWRNVARRIADLSRVRSAYVIADNPLGR